MQALGGNEGVTAMKDAGFEDIEVTRHSVPFYVNPTFGYRELFACMATCTPVHVSERCALKTKCIPRYNNSKRFSPKTWVNFGRNLV